MTNERLQILSTEANPAKLGAKLKSIRETAGIDLKHAAAQLRLKEKIIEMIEEGNYPADLPVTFIRGYIRAYGKFLQIPDSEILAAIEPLQPQSPAPEASAIKLRPQPVTSRHYFMQFFTFAIVITILSLLGTWWHSHTANPPSTTADTALAAPELAAPAPSVPQAEPSLVPPSALNNNLHLDTLPPNRETALHPSTVLSKQPDNETAAPLHSQAAAKPHEASADVEIKSPSSPDVYNEDMNETNSNASD